MTHNVKTHITESTPGGLLMEIITCSCGKSSTAAQMAKTHGGLMASALFGHHPCIAIQELWQNDLDELTFEE
jgi:hypothetical protein